MDYENIKKLMDAMGNSKLTSLDIDFPDGTKISMKKENQIIATEKIIQKSDVVENVVSENKEIATENDQKIEEGKIVKSPMVGTFYTKPSPDSDPYVSVGKVVKKGDILCIIEAMKLMNEIESEFDGEIIEIIAEDGKPVEYGAPLFRIK